MSGQVGYVNDRLIGDNGSGVNLGPFESRMIGIDPQVGYLFPIAGIQGYANVKGYGEFDARNRPPGWDVWLKFSISPTAPSAAKN